MRKGAKPLRLTRGPRNIAANTSARFVLKLPLKLRTRLAKLPHRRSLRMRLTVSATAPGEATKLSLSVRLKGRAKSR